MLWKNSFRSENQPNPTLKREKTVEIVDELSAKDRAPGSSREHGHQGFAVAAYMGSHFARYINDQNFK